MQSPKESTICIKKTHRIPLVWIKYSSYNTFMRRIIFYGIPIIALGTILYSFFYSDILGIRKYISKSICDKTIAYKIGSIDPRFGLSEAEVLGSVKQASLIWNASIGKQLFTYDTNAELTINMVYDRRQSLNTQINQLENNLKTGKTTLKNEIANFEKMSQDFVNRQSDFNKRVDYWNEQGGAPEEEYNKLSYERQSLNDEATRLNAIAKELDISTDQYNIQVGELNQTIQSFKNELSMKPEEGIYDPQEKRIEVYFNINRNELIRTIAHELGHARGIGHSTNNKAIMYPSTTENLSPVPEEISELTEICRYRPFYELLIEKNIWNLDK